MAEPITVYKGEREIQVAPEAMNEALAKGWSKEKGKSPLLADPLASKRRAPDPTSPMSRAVNSFGAGINPIHTPPKDMAPPPGFNPQGSTFSPGGMVRGAMDMVNAREIASKSAKGDMAGAIGMGAGSIAGLLGPNLIKGGGAAMKAGGEAARGAREVPMLAKAVERAKATATELGGGVDTARFGEMFVAPLREALDKKFAPIHKALADKAMGMSFKAEQLINRLAQSEIPAVKKFAADLMRNGTPRTALDYREAKKLSESTIPTTINQLKKLRADHWTPELEALKEQIETGIDGLAKAAKKGAARDKLKQMYGEVQQLKTALIGTAKTDPSTMRELAGAIGGAVGGAAVGHPYVGMVAGMRAAAGKIMKANPEIAAQAKTLATKLGIDPKVLLAGEAKGIVERTGKGIETTGRVGAVAENLGRAYRGVAGAISSPPRNPEAPEQQ